MVKNYQSYLSGTGCIRSTGGIVIPRTLLRRMGTVTLCHIKACYSTWQSCHINAHVIVDGNHKLLHPDRCYRGQES